jgi:hypothetical protein
MEMSFNTKEGRKFTLKGVAGDALRVVTTKKIHAIFKCEEVAYAAK